MAKGTSTIKTKGTSAKVRCLKRLCVKTLYNKVVVRGLPMICVCVLCVHAGCVRQLMQLGCGNKMLLCIQILAIIKNQYSMMIQKIFVMINMLMKNETGCGLYASCMHILTCGAHILSNPMVP